MIWKNVALKLFSLAVAKQDVQLSWRLDGWDNMFLGRAARVDRRLQREPVIGVRTEYYYVEFVLDWAEQIAAKIFHRHAAGKAREIQLGRLREARKICHHDD